LTITNKLSFAVADAVAGRQMTIAHVTPTFSAGAKIEVDTTGLADNQEPHRFVLATSEKAFVGTPVLANASLKWGIRFSADRKSILFRRVRGQAISFR
jgi:hypothetical protein